MHNSVIKFFYKKNIFQTFKIKFSTLLRNNDFSFLQFGVSDKFWFRTVLCNSIFGICKTKSKPVYSIFGICIIIIIIITSLTCTRPGTSNTRPAKKFSNQEKRKKDEIEIFFQISLESMTFIVILSLIVYFIVPYV